MSATKSSTTKTKKQQKLPINTVPKKQSKTFNNMKKYIFKFIIITILFSNLCSSIFVAKAQNNGEQNIMKNESNNTTEASTTQEFFKAKITGIENTDEQVGLDGIKNYIQTFKLKALEGSFKNKEITIVGSEFNVAGKDVYKKNDQLLISQSKDENGINHFIIVDYVRESALYLLIFIFVGLVILIGKKKGIKALLSLVFSFLVIVFFILPQILGGGNPVLISAVGGILITVVSLYMTYGFKGFTHLAAISIGSSLLITVFISQWFTALTKLTGTMEEQTTYLSEMLGSNFNTKGLLLAGFIIGALGVLDDIVINQISLLQELHQVDRRLTWRELFRKGLKVGIDHISAIVNSLFLAYVGASLPLLLLFSADKSLHLSFANTMNLEIIATEIVRTLAGSVGLIIAVPIATIIAAVYYGDSQKLLLKK